MRGRTLASQRHGTLERERGTVARSRLQHRRRRLHPL